MSGSVLRRGLQPLSTCFLAVATQLNDWAKEPRFTSGDIRRREVLTEYRAAQAAVYYEDTANKIFDMLEPLDFQVAIAAYELLYEDSVKSGKTRHDKYSPFHSHETDQFVEYVIGLLEPESALYRDRDSIEETLGSLEKLIVAKILHDRFENDKVFAELFEPRLRERVLENQRKIDPLCPAISQKNDNIIVSGMRSAELLTHLRKFKLENFGAVVGEDVGFSRKQMKYLKDSHVIDLGDRYGEFFKNKMLLHFEPEDPVPLDRVGVYGLWNTKSNSPNIAVTLYGGKDSPVADWHTTFQTLTNFPYELIAKLDDRASNLGSRFAALGAGYNVPNFTLAGTRAYFDSSRLLLNTVATGERAINKHNVPPISPYIRSSNASLGLLDVIASVHMMHTNLYNRGCDKNMDPLSLDGTSLNVSRFFNSDKVGDVRILHGNDTVPAEYYLSNDLYKILQQLGDLTPKEMGFDHHPMLKKVIEPIASEGGEAVRDMLDAVMEDVEQAREHVESRMRFEF